MPSPPTTDANERQREYYNTAGANRPHAANSAATNLWRTVRRRAFTPLEQAGIYTRLTAVHQTWMGDVSELRVLDLGCGGGNPLSHWLATNAREYVAIELSDKLTDRLRKMLPDRSSVRVYCDDFLSPTFSEGAFDLVYAKSVFHHFNDFGKFLNTLDGKLNGGARVITLDPIQTWLPIRVVRALYRPFQTDAEWEHPFKRATLRLIQDRFEVLDAHGLYGQAKWAAAASIVSTRLGRSLADRWVPRDFEARRTIKSSLSCLQLSCHLRRKAA
jgi:2-polyprenyl-3-methyl-5-hydroxy-6-metoxy-1,4-benzoquinol methylase